MSSKPGPAPKRSEERRRRNPPAAGEPTLLDVEQIEAEDPDSLPFLIKQDVVVPEPVGEWHEIAREFWESLKRSGQAIYWEPSDWAVAKLICESISRDLKPQVVGISPANEFGPAEAITDTIPLKGASLGAYLKAFGQLMLTEGERRRMALELQRPRAVEKRQTSGTVVPFKQTRGDRLRGKAAVDG